MKVLLTGGSGFIGTNLVELLLCRGDEVLNLDLSEPRNPEHVRHWRQADLRDVDRISSIVTDFHPEVLFHLGARTDLLGNGLSDYRANTDGVRNIISAMQSAGSIKRVFFASSRLVCQIGYQPKSDEDYCPQNAYGQSKVETEKIVRAAGLEIPWCIFRPTSIWGPWFDIPYKDFFLHVAKGRYFHPQGTPLRKSFGFVGNSVHQLLTLSQASPEVFHGRTFYLCDYPPIEVSEWADEIADEIGVKRPRRVPIGVLGAAAKAGDLLKSCGMKNPPLTSFRLNNLTTQMPHDTEFLERSVGDLPFSRKEGVRLTVEWLRATEQI